MTVIRLIEEHDILDVHDMIVALTAHHGDVAEVSQADLERDALGNQPWVRILVAETDARIVGYAALLPHGSLHRGKRAMDLHHLFVVEAARSTGVGQSLITESAALAKSLGCSTLWVGTDPDNSHAQGVYETYGFERVEYAAPKFKLSLA